MNTFIDAGVPARLTEILAARGITEPTPIQTATLPDSLAGRDVLGRGRTGSGKTYAFLLPLVARLMGGAQPRTKSPRALILAPTRELVTQIEEALEPLAKAANLRSRTIFGGVGQNPQVIALRQGVDVAIACPGRLEDLINQGHADLGDVEITILDEADHMADLGFLPGVRRLMSQTPKDGQRLLFSATLDNGIDVLAKKFLHQPVTHEADSAQSPVATMTHHVLEVHRDQRVPVLTDLTSAPGRTVVFTRTKYGAKGLARQLNRNGVPAVELHGNLSQNARVRNMDAFHSGKATVLVATDIAARGIHVDDVALVIHADPPAEHKAYLHRSGRTARAGNEGTVVTLMTPEQRKDVRDLTRAAGIKPTYTAVGSLSDDILVELAPGDRVRPGALEFEAAPSGGGTSTGANARRKRAAREARGNGQAPRTDRKPARAESGEEGSTPNRNRRRRSGQGQSGQSRPGQGRTEGSRSSGPKGQSKNRPATAGAKSNSSTANGSRRRSAGSANGSGTGASQGAGQGRGGQSRNGSGRNGSGRNGSGSSTGRGGHSAANFSSGRR